MSNDVVKQYVALRTKLAEEKLRLEVRLQAITKALELDGPGIVSPPRPTEQVAPRSPKQPQNSLSLREAILKVIAAKPLTKKEILDAVLKVGYRFGTDKPLRNINAMLYGKKPKFKQQGGKFRVA